MTTLQEAVKQMEINKTPMPISVKTREQVSIAASKSKEFHLVSVPCNKLPILFAATAKEDGPVIIDVNSERIGKLECGYVPKVIVLSA